MMTPEDVHRDVGAYALGVLEPRDSARFEQHLAVCRSCPRELAELSSVAAVLSHVNVDSLAFADRAGRDPRRSEALPGAARVDRRHAPTRNWLTLAACVAMLVAGAVVAASLALGRSGLPGAPPISPTAPKLHAVSNATGTEATVEMEPKRWGSQVTLQVTHVKGPVTCRLLAVSGTGRSEVVMGWTVPPEGYGTDAQPAPLVLYGGTDLPATDLVRFEVRTLGGALLVSVPT
jgi:hypothetical protein